MPKVIRKMNQVVFDRTPAIAVLLLLLAGKSAIGQETSIRFDREIAPLLIDNCLDCHGDNDPQGGLNLLTAETARIGGESGKAIDPGNLESSLIWQRVSSNEMPPKSPLSEPDKRVLRQWIQQGASWGTSPIDRVRVTTNVDKTPTDVEFAVIDGESVKRTT